MTNNLRRITICISVLTITTILFTGCATIVGGGKYYAHVSVPDHPNASISYNGSMKGKGYASFLVPRVKANKFCVTVQDENCDAQNFFFSKKSFRGWALVGSIVTWTAVFDGIPVPFGVFVDLITGALWKPDINEKGVTKTDFKHYNYLIPYTALPKMKHSVPDTIQIAIKSKAVRILELKELLNKSLITQEEFDKQRNKIIEE